MLNLARYFGRGSERDLRDEIQFHIDMRAHQHVRNDGMLSDEAARRATQEFGDVEEIVTKMRHAHVENTSRRMLFVMASTISVTILLWALSPYSNFVRPRTPPLPRPPMKVDQNRRPSGPPPRPRPGPTWEEFVRQVN